MKATTPSGANPVPSPCISVCRMDPAVAVCEGCLRTLDEIAVWSLLDDGEKLAVWMQLRLRRQMRDAGAPPAAAATPPPSPPT